MHPDCFVQFNPASHTLSKELAKLREFWRVGELRLSYLADATLTMSVGLTALVALLEDSLGVRLQSLKRTSPRYTRLSKLLNRLCNEEQRLRQLGQEVAKLAAAQT